ncbi:hypothetical protein A2J03_09890 [Rhodococcus sp. EPR-157]|uniref:hypothetical protein n=1 Tax=Rhodococcus sp. EPR-157 TaxID=1813677 RepID=UPI0007BB8AC9|nr:hypothetical protein [Rhodococcus sp. EPR-157]KZF00885.1 hypothetical protein A2J03_09890 [Rhodococcus sp. EPR-157]
MFAQIDEMTDAPIRAELTTAGRVRVAYSSSVVLTLDVGEAVDLVTAVVDVLAKADQQAQSKLRRDETEIRSAATIREEL